MYTTIIGMFINIPVSIFFVRVLDYGVSGIVYGSIFSLLVSSIAIPIQVYINRSNWLGL